MASPTVNSVPTTEVTNLGSQSLNIQALVSIDGFKWGAGAQGTGVTLTYSFIKAGSVFAPGYGVDVTPSSQITVLTAAEQAAVEKALFKWEHVANIDFTKVTETTTVVGEFRVGKSFNANDIGASAYAYLPGTPGFLEVYWAGDLWISRVEAGDPIDFNEDGANAPEGSYDFSTLMHELGHALGLQHPHNDGDAGEVFLVGNPDTAEDLDLMLTSIMSYQYGFGLMPGFEPTTPMVLDIAAIQYLYGPNNSYNAGATTYSFSATGQYNQTIWDGGGVDTIVYSGSTGGVIDLNPGNASQLGVPVDYFSFDPEDFNIYEDSRTVWIALGAKIENARGGAGDDEIFGNTLINNLQGNGGNDILHGGGNNDTLLGQNGNDLLFGDGGVDVLDGGGGSDTLNGGAGKDVMNGGPGNDLYIVDIVGETITEQVDQGNDTVQSTKTLTLPLNVENLLLLGSAALNGNGNDLDNKLTGNDGINTLLGKNGKDSLDGGLGNDLLRGGGGADNFVFNDPLSASNIDTIGDFNANNVDKIVLDDDIFTALTAGALNGANFVASSVMSVSAGQYLLYNTSNGVLYYDPDADGVVGGLTAIAFVQDTNGNPVTLGAEDFLIVT